MTSEHYFGLSSTVGQLPRPPALTGQPPNPAVTCGRNVCPGEVLALVLALAGYWMPWLTHPAAALRLNGYELSEWLTFLPGIGDSSQPVSFAGDIPNLLPVPLNVLAPLFTLSRLACLLPLASIVILLGITGSRFRPPAVPYRPRWQSPLWTDTLAGWLCLLVALICLLGVFPPYDAYVTPAYWPEYRLHFAVACVTVAILGLTLYCPGGVNDFLQIICAAIGGAYGVWVLLAVRPAALQLLAVWPIGIGWYMMLAGFGWLVISGCQRLTGPRI